MDGSRHGRKCESCSRGRAYRDGPLAVREAVKAIEFYQKAFGAELLSVHKMPNGKVMHAALKIGDSILMLADEFPAWSEVTLDSGW